MGEASVEVTSAPSDTRVWSMRPEIGASTVAKRRSSCRRASTAWAWATSAAACSRWDTASSYTCRLTASARTSGASRSAWMRARASTARARCRAAAAVSTSALKGAGLIWNSAVPAWISAPWLNSVRCRMPLTWGRISAVRKAATRPGRSSSTTSSVGARVITVTRAGGMPSSAVGDGSHPARPNANTPIHTARSRPFTNPMTHCPHG